MYRGGKIGFCVSWPCHYAASDILAVVLVMSEQVHIPLWRQPRNEELLKVFTMKDSQELLLRDLKFFYFEMLIN